MEHLKTLETMVDQLGLAKVVEMLAEICYAREEHLAADWRDMRAAREWRQAGKLIDSLASKLSL
jgi:hypothetical protein